MKQKTTQADTKKQKVFPKKIDKLINTAITEGVFAGAAVGVSMGTAEKRKKSTGYYGHSSVIPQKNILKKQDVFDLASLTKPLATTLAVLCLLKEKKIKTEETLGELFGLMVPGEKKKITIKQLLSHRSGLPAHKEYYRETNRTTEKKRKVLLLEKILKEKLENPPGRKTIYSDLGFMLLGLIIEKRAGVDLDRFFAERVAGPLGLSARLFFNPRKKEKNKKGKKYVATEDCPWRKKVLCGDVHDDNAYALGGVAGHAGLFGSLAGVLDLLCHLLDQWQDKSTHPAYDNKDLKDFLEYGNRTRGARALGFDRPQKKGSSSGDFFSARSVGHLGFTGCSFWVDPEKELIVVLLTNRVHPDRKNEKIREFRPRFHDMVIREIFNTAQIERVEKEGGGKK